MPAETLLIVEDDEALRGLLVAGLSGGERAVATAATAADALSALSAAPNVIVLDLLLPDGAGVEVLRRARAADPSCMVVIITGHVSERTVVEATQVGAMAFLPKPFDLEEDLAPLVDQAFRRGREERMALRSDPGTAVRPPALEDLFVGRAPAMVTLFTQVARLAAADVPVLISGESGTGKELVAQALHRHGPRPDGPFVVVDCASLPPNLIESELFGHVKGAFTGATDARRGKFEEAQDGTVFLDEIGNVPAELQPKLLRALQERVITRVGSNQPVPWNARVVAATNLDLAGLVREGRFREDLRFRLVGAEVRIPPLRERLEDVPLLADHFLRRFTARGGRACTLSLEASRVLREHPWPGNVRELEQAIGRAAALAPASVIRPEDLPDDVRGSRPLSAAGLLDGAGKTGLITMEEVKRRYARHALEACGGNKSEAARLLDVDRGTLANLLGTKEPER